MGSWLVGRGMEEAEISIIQAWPPSASTTPLPLKQTLTLTMRYTFLVTHMSVQLCHCCLLLCRYRSVSQHEGQT